MLQFQDSNWTSTHFCVVTLDKTIDVLAEHRPTCAWVTPSLESR